MPLTFSTRRREKNRKRLRAFFLVLFLPPLLLLALGVGVSLLAIERTPLVPPLPPAAVDDAVRARALTRKAVKAISTGESAVLTATADDLNGFLVFASQGVGRLSGRVDIHPEALRMKMTIHLPPRSAGVFLNLRVNVLPSQAGIKVDGVRFGRLQLPPPVALFFLRRGLDLGLGLGEGGAALESVTAVSILDDSVRIHLNSLPRLRSGLKRLGERAAALRDEIAPLGGLPVDPKTVRLYLTRLQQSDRPSEKVSIAEYLGPLFYLAQARSSDSDPVEENRAALLALAIHLGDRRFAHLVGTEPARKSKGGGKVVLGGRKDLRLHFVISAGLKLMADQGTGFAVGEMKELLDSGEGGSGFSFVDLAADRAGIRFAAEATANPESARRLQGLLAAGAREDLFFPFVADLPENLTRGEFEGRFGHVGSAAYGAMVKEIDARLARCPAYHPG